MKFLVTVIQTLSKTVEVEASDATNAVTLAKEGFGMEDKYTPDLNDSTDIAFKAELSVDEDIDIFESPISNYETNVVKEVGYPEFFDYGD